MNKPLDESYFVWLYSQVGDTRVRNPHRTYWNLLRALYTKEFVWFVANDDNRLEDGKELRCEFVNQERLNDVDCHWIELGCSMLELLVALSRRLAFQTNGAPRDWFWVLIGHLGLREFSDEEQLPMDFIEETLERVIFRTYDPDGVGGLFPLRHPDRDQRHVELWYQLNAYVQEHS